jgi:hypothetical protein
MTRLTHDSETNTWVDSEEYYTKKARKKFANASYVMADIREFVSPMDGKMVSSRSQLREHEIKHGVRQCGELTSHRDFDSRAEGTKSLMEKQRRDGYRD